MIDTRVDDASIVADVQAREAESQGDLERRSVAMLLYGSAGNEECRQHAARYPRWMKTPEDPAGSSTTRTNDHVTHCHSATAMVQPRRTKLVADDVAG